MTKFLSYFILLSSSLILLASIALFLTQQNNNSQTLNQRVLFKDETGNLKNAQGGCSQDADCLPAGCGKEICSNTAKVYTTCGITNKPSELTDYQCGCVSQKCAWYKK